MTQTARMLTPRGGSRALLALLAAPTLAALALGAGAGADMPAWAALGALAHLPAALAVAALYLLPGLALLRLLWPAAPRLHPAARLALAVGVSAALPPLALLAASTLGLRWGAAATWAYLAASAAALLWRPRARLAELARWRPDRATLLLALITAATVATRLYTTRDLRVGLWADSYHHTMIAQLLLDHGGLFQSWMPYAPLASFTYHFGFHSNIAFVAWLTGIDSAWATLLVGQLLSAAAAPLAFALTCAVLRGRPEAGLWAALLVGFATVLPAQYATWGRYTQLAGQIVGVALLASWAALTDRRATWRAAALAGICGASMMLTHYLVALVIAALLASLLLAELLATRDAGRMWRALPRLALAAAIALALALPWLLNLGSGHLARNAAGIATQSVGAAHVITYSAIPRDIVPLYARGPLIALALAGVCAALWRRDWRMALTAVWSALALLIIAPYLVGLPGAGIVDHLTALAHWFLTLTAPAGYALWALRRAAAGRLRRVRRPAWPPLALAALAALALMAWGVRWQVDEADRSTQLVGDADLAAMAWVRASTPPDARFLVNSYPTYSGFIVIGSDAGWWIPLLAGRATTLPPMTYGTERGPSADYAHQVNSIAAALRERRLTDLGAVSVDLTTPDALAVLRGHAIGYVYSGAQASPADGVDRIDVARLRASPEFELAYDRGGVQIFRLVRP